MLEIIGARPLRDLSAGECGRALGQLTSRYSTRSLQITRNSLDRAIQHAQANDLVGRNVAALVKPPRGRAGRPSKSFTLEQAKALLAAAEGTRMHAYVALSLLSASAPRRPGRCGGITWCGGWGTPPDGSRSPRPDSIPRRAGRTGTRSTSGGRSGTAATPRPVSHGGPWRCRGGAWRRSRAHGSCQAKDRLRAGQLWQDHGLVFASTVGTPLTANNVIRAFRVITEKAGLGEDWVPREMRHTFVSVLSANGVPVESIALLAGHDRTSYHRIGLPPRDPARAHPGRGGDGQDLRLANRGRSYSPAFRQMSTAISRHA